MHLYWSHKEILPRTFLHQEPYFKENGKIFDIENQIFFSFENTKINYCFRDDGIVIAISIWQCFLEFCTNSLITSILIMDQSFVILELLLLITYFFNYVIFPSFYLLADSRFRKVFHQKGGLQAVWLALKQKYNWIVSYVICSTLIKNMPKCYHYVINVKWDNCIYISIFLLPTFEHISNLEVKHSRNDLYYKAQPFIPMNPAKLWIFT